MDERWKRFIFRSVVSAVGAGYAYLSSTTFEAFAVKALFLVVLQSLLSSLGEAPLEGLKVQKQPPWYKKWMSRF